MRRARARERDRARRRRGDRARRGRRLGAVDGVRCAAARLRTGARCSRGWWWGSVRLDAFEASVLAPEIGRSAAVTAVVTGPVRRSTFALRLPAEVRRFDERSAPRAGAARVAARPLAAAGSRARAASDRRGAARPGGRLRRARLARAPRRPRRPARARLADGRPPRRHRRPLRSAPRARRARDRARGSTGERHAVLAGIVLGEDEGLTDELRDDFKASGLYHLLAVSGQNITFLALGVLGLAWLLGIPQARRRGGGDRGDRRLRPRGRLAAVGRARRRGGRARVAGLAALPAARPLALPRARRRRTARVDAGEPARARVPALVRSRRLDLPRCPPASAGARGLPAHELAPRGARRLDRVRRCDGTDPLAPVRQRPASTRCRRTPSSRRRSGRCSGSRSSARLLEPVLPSAALALGWLNGWLAAYIAACARADRGACRSRRSDPPRPSACCSGRRSRCSFLQRPAAVAATAGGRERRGSAAGARSPGSSSRRCVCRRRPGLRITFLDVGQGDSILLQVPEGAVLVDQGPPEADVARQLRGLGVRRLAAIVLTHPQRDHVGGAEAVLRRLARRSRSRSAARGLRARSSAPRSPRRRIATCRSSRRARATASRLGRLRLRVLWPDGAGTASENPNQLAIVLLATLRRGRRAVDRRRRDGRDGAAAVVAGSRSSRSRITARPIPGSRPSCASCGRRSRSSPAAATTSTAIRRRPRWPRSATAQGCSLYRTDEDGRVVLESDGRRISVRSER